jgi:hypothetical protein
LERWQTWANVIGDLAANRMPALDENTYQTLHRNLINVCRLSDSTQQSATCRQIVDIAQPWLALATLAATDAETIASLHRQCHTIHEKLGIRERRLPWIAAILVMVVVAAVCYFLLPALSVAPFVPTPTLPRHQMFVYGGAAVAAALVLAFAMKKIFRVTIS